MGRIIKKIKIMDLVNQEIIHSKRITGGKEFNLIIHNLDNRENLQIGLIRPDVIDLEQEIYKKYLYIYYPKTQQLRLDIDAESFMLPCAGIKSLIVKEYNSNGKAAIVINILFETGENDSSKFCSELKKYFKEDNQDEK